MMLQTILWIIIGIVFLIGFIRLIDWYAIFRHFYGDNPQRARVYVIFGEDALPCDGNYAFNDDKYLFYNYRLGGVSYAVAVPLEWDYVFIRGRRMIKVEFGKEHAIPLCQRDVAFMGDKGGVLLNASIDKKLATDSVNEIRSHKGIGFSNIIIIIAVIAALAIAYFVFIKPNIEKSSITPVEITPVPQQTTIPITSPEDLEVLEQLGGSSNASQ